MLPEWTQWLQLLNVLLLPALVALWNISATLAEIKAKLSAHEDLDRERFKDLDRRLERLEIN